jgi:hypothetical protein
MRLNLGPEGIRLWAAGYASILLGYAIFFVTFILSMIAAFTSLPSSVPLASLIAGFLVMSFGIARIVQSNRAGKAFRGGRPLIRRGIPLRPEETAYGEPDAKL